eukprot:TRINITY_DN63668_c0_g1_i1.p1 TRINITY_DN63668_c0_g1~~TRINITY_DN63668_c0_g1_i1.p1  ORF type:complete len:713 (-),score=137.23 TRINITY_DN63668_c0_g1_i1:104-2242(-)
MLFRRVRAVSNCGRRSAETTYFSIGGAARGYARYLANVAAHDGSLHRGSKLLSPRAASLHSLAQAETPTGSALPPDTAAVSAVAVVNEQEDQSWTERPGGPRRRQLNAWATPGSEVYANPICSQLDQLLLRCDTFEDVLALLVTHRGVFFVHNLVTGIQVLAALAEEADDVIAVNEMLRDPRYDLLIRDLLRFVPKLDFLAMTNVSCSLWQLDHKHYLLLTRMLRPLLKVPVPDVGTLLRCVQAYTWAGYGAHDDFYHRCAEELAKSAPTLDQTQIVTSCAVFGSVPAYHRNFFLAFEEAVLERGLIIPTARNGQEVPLSPRDVSIVASAFAAHLRTAHDRVFDRVAEFVEREAEGMVIPDLAKCLGAFRRVALRYEGAVEAASNACAAPLQRAWLLRQRAGGGTRTSDVATVLESAAFFGVRTDLMRVALEYLADADRVDEVNEASAIKVVYAMSATGTTGLLPRLLLLLFRKIGAGTAWEAERLRVFHLWVCQRLQFPWLDARMPRRCLNAGMRAWCMHRHGYGSPFPREVRGIATELEAMGVMHRTFVPMPDSPYEVDIAVGRRKDALLVLSETARNSLDPVGGALLQVRHFESRGWRCVVVPRRVWLMLKSSTVEARRGYLQALLAYFEDPRTSRPDGVALMALAAAQQKLPSASIDEERSGEESMEEKAAQAAKWDEENEEDGGMEEVAWETMSEGTAGSCESAKQA